MSASMAEVLARDGNYSPEACETCRAVETLRDRAVTERGRE